MWRASIWDEFMYVPIFGVTDYSKQQAVFARFLWHVDTKRTSATKFAQCFVNCHVFTQRKVFSASLVECVENVSNMCKFVISDTIEACVPVIESKYFSNKLESFRGHCCLEIRSACVIPEQLTINTQVTIGSP